MVAAVVPWTWFLVRDIHPVLGFVAIAMPLLVLGALAFVAVVAAVLRSATVLLVLSSLGAFGAVAIVGPWLPHDRPAPQKGLVLLSANMGGPEDPAAADAGVRSVLSASADVVVIAELSPIAARALADAYPYHAQTFPEAEQAPEPPAVGIFSRLPIVEVQTGADGLPGIRAVVEGRDVGRFALYAVHVPKPGFGGPTWSTSFSNHERIVDRLADAAEAEELPVLVAGDLNTSDRSAAYRRLTSQLSDAARADRTGPTSIKASLLWRLLALRVDHVVEATPWCSAHSSRPHLAYSDHRAVRVEVGPCPPG